MEDGKVVGSYKRMYFFCTGKRYCPRWIEMENSVLACLGGKCHLSCLSDLCDGVTAMLSRIWREWNEGWNWISFENWEVPPAPSSKALSPEGGDLAGSATVKSLSLLSWSISITGAEGNSRRWQEMWTKVCVRLFLTSVNEMKTKLNGM